ncbi:unnamed protein product [Malus baccata var. baccata]
MAGSGGGELRTPIFNGENFDFWQIKMKTIFRSYELWNMVEGGYRAPANEKELTEAERKLLRENVVKDARALGIIQSVGYEQRLDRHGESSMEKAFASLKFAPKSNKFNGQPNSNKYHKNFKPKEKQWSSKGDWSNKVGFTVKNEANNTGDKCKFYDRLHYGDCWVKNKVKCHKCNKIGHIARYCNANKTKISDEWYIDSGCGNHMTSREDLLVDIDI